MKNISLKEISNAVNGELYGKDYKGSYSFGIDSRNFENHNFFIPLKGDRFDGHNYIKDVDKKAICVLCSYEKKIKNIRSNIIYVDDTQKALHKLSRFYRSMFQGKVIAITGSNGKTSVKELLALMLKKNQISFTQGNLNNHIGMPLTIINSNHANEFLILEIGISIANEMKTLAEIAKPDIATVTNIGKAHLEGLGGEDGVYKEKTKLFDYVKKSGTCFINLTDVKMSKYSKKNGLNYLTFGSKDSDYYVETREKDFFLNLRGETVKISPKYRNNHDLINISCAASIADYLKIEVSEIVNGIENFCGVKSRLNLKKLKNGATLIDDTYNANPGSFKVALDTLKTAENEKWLVFGDMVELGSDSAKYHKEVVEYALSCGVDKIITYGKESKTAATSLLGEESLHLDTIEEIFNYIVRNMSHDLSILVKGSRAMSLDKLTKQLVEFQ